jgi:hypothetical protein
MRHTYVDKLILNVNKYACKFSPRNDMRSLSCNLSVCNQLKLSYHNDPNLMYRQA